MTQRPTGGDSVERKTWSFALVSGRTPAGWLERWGVTRVHEDLT
jgi:hypothetical protein